MAENMEKKLAVLIDADNVSAQYIKPMVAEIARYGNPTIKRIYGDWTKPNLTTWKQLLLEFAFQPVQQFGYTTGKNATDSAMIIDAMDLLYSQTIDGFCLVSSDSDFTRLATRLRESGKIVYGIGERKTPLPFIAACDKFIYLEILNVGDDEEKEMDELSEKPREVIQERKGDNPLIRKINRATVKLIKSSITDEADYDGWAFLGAVGNLVMKKRPDFDSRNYGFAKLSQMIRSIDSIESQERKSEKDVHVTLFYIRNKDEVPAKKTDASLGSICV